MAMSILQIRVDDNLKNEVSDLFERLGMDIPTAVRIFFKRAIIERGLPFNVNEIPSATTQDNSRLMQALYALNDEAHKNGTAGMSEEEIEAEIKAARAERKKKHGVRSRSYKRLVFCRTGKKQGRIHPSKDFSRHCPKEVYSRY